MKYVAYFQIKNVMIFKKKKLCGGMRNGV